MFLQYSKGTIKLLCGTAPCQCQHSPRQEHCREEPRHKQAAGTPAPRPPSEGSVLSQGCWGMSQLSLTDPSGGYSNVMLSQSHLEHLDDSISHSPSFFFLFIKNKAAWASEKPVCKIKVCIKARYEKLSSWQAVAIWRCIYLSGNQLCASNRETIPYKQQH